MNLIFDLDGTLTDSAPGITRSMAHAFEQLGLTPPEAARLEAHIGPPIRETFRQLLAGSGVQATPDLADRAVVHFRERYRDVGLFENTIYDGIPEALSALADHRLFVATGKAVPFAARILDHFGLTGHFEGVHGAELDGTRADKGELLAHVMARHDLDPETTVMIGDTHVDMRAGRIHRFTTIGVSWGYGTDLAREADHVLDHPAGLPNLVRRLLR